MKCSFCSEELSESDVGDKYAKCSACGRVFRTCGEGVDAHIINCQLHWCPICGNIVESSVSSDVAAFVWREYNGRVETRRWSDPISIGLNNNSNVFHVIFDSFLILISSNGHYVIYLGENEFYRSVITDGSGNPFNGKREIHKLANGTQHIFFSTRDGHLFSTSLASLFDKPEIKRIESRVQCFDYDPISNVLAYASNNCIMRSDFENEMISIGFEGKIGTLIVRNDFCFWLNVGDKLTLETHSIKGNRSSRRSITFTSSPDSVKATANGEYVAIVVAKGRDYQLYSGSWKHLVRNSNNWNIANLTEPVNRICLNNSDLLYIQYQGSIERKEVLAPDFAVRNVHRSVADMIPQSLNLSLDGQHVSVCCRDTAAVGFDASKVIVLSEDMSSEFQACPRADFLIDKYYWVNGKLSCLARINGGFYLSSEVYQ